MKRIYFYAFFIASINTSYAQSVQDDYFITTWNTRSGASSNSTEITLPIVVGAYDVDIDNDGTFDLINHQSQTVNLITPGEHTIAVRPSETNETKQLRINFGADGVTGNAKLMSIDKWGTIVWTSMENAFFNCSNMTLADDAGVPDLTIVANMNSVFQGASSFTGDLSNWDVSQVLTMGHMFKDATSFTSDLSRWNVSKVYSMSFVFFNASSFTSDLSSWDVSQVVTTIGMFSGASSFTSDLSSWDVSRIEDMKFMFENATSFSRQHYDALLSGWSSLPSLKPNIVFRAPPVNYCGGKAGRDILENNHNWTIEGDGVLECPFFITTWNTEAVTSGVNTIKLPISGGAYDVDRNDDGDFDDDNETNQTGTQTITFTDAGIHTVAIRPSEPNTSNRLQIKFSDHRDDAKKLTSIDRWSSTIVWISMKNAFKGCSNMTISNNAGAPNLTMVTNMNNMFSEAANFTSDLSSWDVSRVTNMSNMFANCTSFTSDLSGWDVSSVIDMSVMFAVALSFTSDLSSWNVSRVTNMGSMFASTIHFNSDLSTWNTSQVTSMGHMFNGATNFTSDLSSWNVSRVTNMNRMLLNANNFNSDLSTWDVSKVKYMPEIFKGATSFTDYNYEKLLVGWSKLSLQSGVTFGAPPANYCAGEAGRSKLRDTHSWVITGDSGSSCSNLALSIDAFLQGPYDTTTNKMSDGLRAASVIPDTSPYGDEAFAVNRPFDVTTGDDVIVDWVQVSLHNPNDASIIISSTSALLQRDGDVVVSDGINALQIQGIAGDYKVSINHRNHIPVITDAAQSLSTTETAIDFTNDLTIVTGGSNAMAEVATGIYALFSGDVNGNNQVQVDDYNAAIQDVGRGGYLTSDVDMNGELQVSDINFVLKTLGKGAQF